MIVVMSLVALVVMLLVSVISVMMDFLKVALHVRIVQSPTVRLAHRSAYVLAAWMATD